MDITLSQNQLIKVTGQLAAEQEKTAQATEVFKQLVDEIPWRKDDAGHVVCIECTHLRHWDTQHAPDCELDAQLTKARAFLDGLGD